MTGWLEGAEKYAEAAAFLAVSHLRTAIEALTPEVRRTVVDHVNAAYRAGWEAGYKEGLADGHR